MTDDYLLCGWRVQSDLALPELLPWTGPISTPVDITIVAGPVPEKLGNAVGPGKYLMVGSDGAVLLHIVGLVRILVRNGATVTVDILHKDAVDSWRLFLLGSALGYLCHQRGVFPLHAATLRIGRRTVAVAGHSGAGKSTLAMALAKQGHALLSDDMTVLRVDQGSAMVLPSFPRLKLWRDSLDALGTSTEGLPRVREGIEKYDLRANAGFDPTPTPLDAILILGEAPEPSIVASSPVAALPVVRSYLFRQKVAVELGRQAALFFLTAEIVQSVPVYRLMRPKRFESLAATVNLIEKHFSP